MGDLIQMDQAYILNVYKRLNIEVEYAEGSYLVDKKGDRYLDLFSGLSVNNLGHRNQHIINNIKDQLDCYLHISNFFVSEPTVDLAKLLVENSFASKIFFSNSGTEANEAAIKLARKYGKTISKNKFEILTANKSFHGRTYGGMTLTGQEKYKKMFTPTIDGVKHFELNDLESLENLVSEQTCAVFLELVQGESGVNEVTDTFMSKLNELRSKYKFLICIDEVQTGMGRTGDLFAYEHYNVTPDLVTLAKSIGGGLPLGALLVPYYLENVFAPGEHGTTFGGNPVSCIAGKAVLEEVIKPSFQKEIKDKGQYVINRVKELKSSYPQLIKQIRGRGLMIGIEVRDRDLAYRIRELAMEKKVLINIASQTVIRLLPPLTISYEELDVFLNLFENIVSTIEKEQ
ncbi:aspartate aminotransferase family protein [Haloplasma contractile]|uniref:Acetylornithine aminotransferase protein n=1 Tax=Haloplasma contractile SSD-17B TaxID=1033810 RepID=U2ECH8_9MOLU|nr:acetylornithine/succinylornithine family transaminase [Haloplasma contractile]ERJ12471.1 Acetylornithine aminotransferase protein [Haloplasma contractile SSD-17B]